MLLFAVGVSCVGQHYSAPAGERLANAKPDSAVIPGGRLLTPVGQHYFTGSGTFGLAVSPDGKTVASADGGPNGFSVTLVRDGAASKLWQRRGRGKSNDDDDWRSVFMGIAYARNGDMYVSEGNSGRVRIGGRAVPLNTRGVRDSYTGDLVVDQVRGIVYVVDQANFRVVAIDAKTRKILSTTRVGRLPFAVALSPDAARLYVTNVGIFEYKPIPGADPKQARETGLPFPAFGFPSKESIQGTPQAPALGDPNVPESNSLCIVDVKDPAAPKILAFVRTGQPFSRTTAGGSSPSGVAATDKFVYVSNAHNDSITVVNAQTLKRERDIPIRIPGLERLRGVMPIGVIVDSQSEWLLAAEAGINAIGIIDPAKGKVLGHVPTAWFPSRVAVQDGRVYVANAKGFGTGPNKGLAASFQADLRRGAITTFPLPRAEELAAHTQRVLANNGFVPSAEANPIPSQLRNVVIIVKENRTYDEVFGEGARFGPAVTPNHHEVARRWAGSDNFYADSEVSVDGHHWLVGAYPNAWTETTLMASYGGEKDFRFPTEAPGRLLFAGSSSSVHPEEQGEHGTLWHHLDRHGISFRNFGEGFELAGVNEGEGLKPTGARFLTNVPMPGPLYRNTSRTYPQYNMNIPDQFRADQLLKELGGMKELPRLLYIHLPNDHTTRPRPKDGYPKTESYVADNDYALGRILEYLSRRPEWKQTAVLVTEDDAQGGVDPVDSHRTVLLIASPYARRGYVSHRHSSFPGLLKTAFRILRIPPLNLYDASAADLSDCFTAEADLRPFDLQPANPAIFDPKKAREPRDPVPSPRMDDPEVLREQHRR